jgi:hypothetical protein
MRWMLIDWQLIRQLNLGIAKAGGLVAIEVISTFLTLALSSGIHLYLKTVSICTNESSTSLPHQLTIHIMNGFIHQRS